MKTSSLLPLRGLTLGAAALLSLVATSNHASAATAITAMTDDGSYGVTSVTIGGTAFSNLVGSTAVATAGFGANYSQFWAPGSTPDITDGSASQVSISASGLSYREGSVNIRDLSTFQFGQVIDAADNIFLLEAGVGDGISFNLIDSVGSVIGDYSIDLVAGDFGSSLRSFGSNANVIRWDNTTTTAALTSIVGTSFQLSDFSGTIGDLSLATGIQVIFGTDSQMDIAAVGITIPEPSDFALLFGAFAGFTGLVLRRRRG